jgi:PAS domain-containing protein
VITKRKTKKRLTSVLGLTFADGHLRACHVNRSKGVNEVVRAASAALTLDLLHPESELVGREIRNHLDAAGIRERHCVVALPARWIMSQHTTVPELSPEDANSFLQIEAEKGFPCDPAQLQIARSFHRSTGAAYVTQLAVRKEQLEQLSAALKAAGLKTVSFSLGLAALPEVIAPAGKGRITVAVEPKGAALLISAGGGIAALRTCEASVESEVGEQVVNGNAVARELRITFEQVPADLRVDVKQLALCGDETMCRQLAEKLTGWAKDEGLTVTRSATSQQPVSDQMAEQVAARWLASDGPEFEFLPPHPGRWAMIVARYNSKRLATVGFALGGVAVLALGFFAWQEYRRWSLRSEWDAMAVDVKALDVVQDRIREFRPWYDESFRNLTILSRVTECFPDNGSVTARSVEIHGITSQTVSISGTARDNASLLRTLDQLRKVKEVQAVKVEQIRGKVPAQFTFTFRWKGNTGS